MSLRLGSGFRVFLFQAGQLLAGIIERSFGPSTLGDLIFVGLAPLAAISCPIPHDVGSREGSIWDEVETLRSDWYSIAEFCERMGRRWIRLRDAEVDFLEDILEADCRIQLSVRQANWLLRIFAKIMPRSERRREQYIKDEWWDHAMLCELKWAPWGIPAPPPLRFDDDEPLPAPDYTNVIDLRRHILAKKLLANCS
jgi:hypothetical protein